MPISIGFLAEGNDHLILCAYLAKLLVVDESDIDPDFIESPGRGWNFVATNIDTALQRFYRRCAQFAVLSMDNDGDHNLQATGSQEDPRHLRHWLHDASDRPERCRWCLVSQKAEAVRPALTGIKNKPGDRWPILIAVPVESIEAWLLITQAILDAGTGSLHAEKELRSTLKHKFYGRPSATLNDVQTKALPLIRQLDADGLGSLRTHSRSFADFAAQVDRYTEEIATSPACW